MRLHTHRCIYTANVYGLHSRGLAKEYQSPERDIACDIDLLSSTTRAREDYCEDMLPIMYSIVRKS